jgi:MFS family permease
MPDDIGRSQFGSRPRSIESRASWTAARVTLAILSLVYGSTLIIVVGLKAIETDLGVPRSVMALAGVVTWIGTGSGGIAMGWLADRIGIRISVMIGAVMVATGLALCGT